jgi:hypothetical protein
MIELEPEDVALIITALLDASIGYSRREEFYGPGGEYPDPATKRKATQNKRACRALAKRFSPYMPQPQAANESAAPPQNAPQAVVTFRRLSKASPRL